MSIQVGCCRVVFLEHREEEVVDVVVFMVVPSSSSPSSFLLLLLLLSRGSDFREKENEKWKVSAKKTLVPSRENEAVPIFG